MLSSEQLRDRCGHTRFHPPSPLRVHLSTVTMQAGLHLAPGVSLAAPAARPTASGSAGRLGVATWRPLASLGVASRAEAPPRPARAAVEAGNGVPVGEYGERVMVAGLDAGPDEMGIKLECDESGCVLVVGKNVPDLEEVESEGFLTCNLTGCYYSPSPVEKEFKVMEGTGWRLGYETAPDSEDSLSAMVGAGGWSIALSASEFHDFCKLIQMLRKGIITMDQDGMLGRDDIVMQVEKGSMWMECVVPKKVLPTLQKFLKFGGRAESSAFEIRFILTGKADKRQAEGYWPAEAVMDMLRKIDSLTSARGEAEASPAQGDAQGLVLSA